jgi:DNA polymerase-4
VVAACSYEARAYGVHSAMPMKLARRLCPDAVVVRGDFDRYSYYSNLVTDIIKESVPLYEKASIDEFYIDLSGMDRFFGCYTYASTLRQRIMAESGLPVSLGFSVNKTVSKVATGEAKPNGERKVETGREKIFLAPLNVARIPMVGEKTARILHEMGVFKVETLQQLQPQLLVNVLGENGMSLWKRANGIDHAPVEPYWERKSIGSEETFDQDSIDTGMMMSTLLRMTEHLAFKLRTENKLTGCVTIKIRYANFDTHTLQSRIPYCCADHVLIAIVKELFSKLYQRRMLVRLIGVKLSHLVYGGHQINLFDDLTEMLNLYQAIDKMKQKFGEDKIHRAAYEVNTARFAGGFDHRDNPSAPSSGKPETS